MDNDSKMKKRLVHIYRSARFAVDYSGTNLMGEKEGNSEIYNRLKEETSLAVCRLGAVEMRCVSKWMRGREYNQKEREQALYAAGIFPNDDDTLNHFCEIYTEAICQCDMLGIWEVAAERKVVKKYNPNVQLIHATSIESYYYENPWTRYLEGKRLLVIHPFSKSIEKQYKNNEFLFQNQSVLPSGIDLKVVKAVQSNAGAKTQYMDWFYALETMKDKISKVDFDIAIIGAGAYGLPLTVFCKQLGKQAVQMSGATQILFGIKGKRWDNHPIISGFYNEYWIRPDIEETPPEIARVEGGSYW